MGLIPVLAMLLAGSAVAMPEQPGATVAALLQQGKLAEARVAAAEALKTHPADAELLSLLGVVHAQENNLAAAEQAMRKAVQLAPRLESAWLNLGRLYQLMPAADATDKGIAAY